jgi:SAM-dependent methyltransferase
MSGLFRGRWVATALALAWAAASLRMGRSIPADSLVFWTAGRALLHGGDPYTAVAGLGTGYPLFYPISAIVLVAPLAWLPWPLFHVVSMGLSGFAFGWAAERYGRGLMAAALSAGFAEAMVEGQWSPLLTAAAVIPTLGFVWGAKPSVGAALFAGFPSRRALLGAAVLLAVGTILRPTWLPAWLAALEQSNHVAPVLRPGGLLLLLALIRWRRPEARVLAALALVPQTTVLYETVPLFLIPATPREGYALALASYVAAFLQTWAVPPGAVSLTASVAARWPIVAVLVWLPALVLVLRRPNSADAHLEATTP